MDNISGKSILNDISNSEKVTQLKKSEDYYKNKIAENIGERIIINKELNKINPKELLTQTNFQHILTGMFNGITQIAEQNQQSNSEVISLIHNTTEFFGEQLKENGSNMSESERMFIYERIVFLNELAFKKDSENKEFYLKLAGMVFTSLATLTVFLLSTQNESDEF